MGPPRDNSFYDYQMGRKSKYSLTLRHWIALYGNPSLYLQTMHLDILFLLPIMISTFEKVHRQFYVPFFFLSTEEGVKYANERWGTKPWPAISLLRSLHSNIRGHSKWVPPGAIGVNLQRGWSLWWEGREALTVTASPNSLLEIEMWRCHHSDHLHPGLRLFRDQAWRWPG